jgi:excinuclease ABC subunit C
VRTIVPQRGERRRVVQLASDNAKEALSVVRHEWSRDAERLSDAMDELQEYLELPNLPLRIECYDISNIQGTSQVASMVVFEEAKSKRSDYKRFQIKTVEGANDFASMQEVLRRRFRRAQNQDEQETSWTNIPDLVIIDGGKGQLGAALEVFNELDITEIPVVGLAKENEELYLPGRSDPVMLPRTSQSLFLVQRIRDEAHRFAITYHRNLRGKKSIRSALDDVPGIGPTRKRALLRHFGTVKAIREANVDALVAVPGISRVAAETIKREL